MPNTAMARNDPDDDSGTRLGVPYRAVHALHARGWTLDPFGHPGACVDATWTPGTRRRRRAVHDPARIALGSSYRARECASFARMDP